MLAGQLKLYECFTDLQIFVNIFRDMNDIKLVASILDTTSKIDFTVDCFEFRGGSNIFQILCADKGLTPFQKTFLDIHQRVSFDY